MKTRGWIAAGLYAGIVGVLAASAFWSPSQSFTWSREAVAMLLTLPALIPALPVIYVVGAALWNVTGASDGGGPMWPVTLVYTLMFVGVAVANVLLLRSLIAGRRQRRSAELPPVQ